MRDFYDWCRNEAYCNTFVGGALMFLLHKAMLAVWFLVVAFTVFFSGLWGGVGLLALHIFALYAYYKWATRD